LSKKYPEILVNSDLCTTPYECKKCIRICPQAVFQVRPAKMVKFQETDASEPGSFRIRVDYGDKCTVCNRCVDVCPNKAVQIVY